jgi:hypothetical protein
VTIAPAWIARFDADGNCAARSLPELTNFREPAVTVPASFDDAKLDAAALRGEMKQALVAAGLFDDEAQAMLDTWEVSYFKSPGTRVFFIVPDEWVGDHLPLKLSVEARVTRVMIGRLELVTPRERALIKQIADAPVPTARSQPDDAIGKAWKDLGRFRNALVLEELKHRPTESLRAFVRLNDLEAFEVPRTVPTK